MKSTHTAVLDIPELSKGATTAHIFPAMENNSLLSVGQLCDEGYSVLFNINEVTILDSTHTILMKGSRYFTTGLLRINLSQNKNRYITAPGNPQIQSVNNVYSLRVYSSGKASAQILHLPLGDDSSPLGDSAVGI
jgi:hypothetical protein